MIAVVERPTVWQRLRPVLLGFDLTLMIAVLLICAIGLVTMYSAGYDYGTRFTDHARNMALAFGVLFVAAQISPQNLMRVAVPLYTHRPGAARGHGACSASPRRAPRAGSTWAW